MRRWQALPPAGAKPAELFRKLLEFPRPVEAISFRFDGAEDEPLFARALRSAEWRKCTGFNWRERLISLSLSDEDGKPVFTNASDAGNSIASDAELNELSDAIVDMVSRIGPVYGFSDSEAWGRVLEQGAADCRHDAFVLASCVDNAIGFASSIRTPRPDRYFGCSTRELLDGHWLCWYAARRTIDRLIK